MAQSRALLLRGLAGLAGIFVAALAPASARAHVPAGALSGVSLWNYDPWLAIPLYTAGFAFFLGTRNLWRAAGFGRGVSLGRSAAYWAAWALTALAFLSPLHWLGERLFAVHMVEHELLLLVTAPLFAYAKPGGVALWSLPKAWRRRVSRLAHAKSYRKLARTLDSPVIMTVQQTAVMYLWHTPTLYEWALRDDTVHRLEHVGFFVSAYLFWRALLPGPGRASSERTREAIAVGCLFITLLLSGLLGALLTLSPRVWYPDQELLAADFGLTPLADQQLAGLIMWIPMGLVYTAVALWLAYRLLQPGRGAESASLPKLVPIATEPEFIPDSPLQTH